MASGDSISRMRSLTRGVGKGFSEYGAKESSGWRLDIGGVVCDWFGKGLTVDARVVDSVADDVVSWGKRGLRHKGFDAVTGCY